VKGKFSSLKPLVHWDHGETIYLAANNLAFIVLLKAHFIHGA